MAVKLMIKKHVMVFTFQFEKVSFAIVKITSYQTIRQHMHDLYLEDDESITEKNKALKSVKKYIFENLFP